MSTTTIENIAFKSDLFHTEPTGCEGEADGLPTLEEVGVDEELQHPYWAAEKAGRLLVGLEGEAQEGIVNYGYRVYRDLLKEDGPIEAVYLDSRCFLPETNLLDVLNVAANTAIDYEDTHLVAPIVRGMIDTAKCTSFSSDTMRQYMPTVMRSVDITAIRAYVEFMNENTVKGPEDSKQFLKEMAHAVRALPQKRLHLNDPGLDRLDKQVLLEDIGHAWIRRAMPVAEIDWLP